MPVTVELLFLIVKVFKSIRSPFSFNGTFARALFSVFLYLKTFENRIMEAYDGKINNESPKNNHSLHFERCLSKDLDDSTSRTRSQSRQRKHRYKNTLHLWEFLLELLADESCKSIICWRRKEYGEFQLIDHHEVAKRWGQLKKRNDMNYSKLSRALRLYYQQGIITKVSLTNQKIIHEYFEKYNIYSIFKLLFCEKTGFVYLLRPMVGLYGPS